MIDNLPTWNSTLAVGEWPPTARVEIVMRIYEQYEKLPTPIYNKTHPYKNSPPTP